MDEWDGVDDEDCRISHESESSDSSIGGEDRIRNEEELKRKVQREDFGGPEFSFANLDVPVLQEDTGKPLANHKMTALKPADAGTAIKKQSKISSLHLPKFLHSSDKREDFCSRKSVPQETKLKVNWEGLSSHENVSPARTAAISGKTFRLRETVKEADQVYLESAEHEIKRYVSHAYQGGYNGTETNINQGFRQQTLMNNGHKPIKACPVSDTSKIAHESDFKSNRSCFRNGGGENQAITAVNGFDTACKSIPQQNKGRKNGETLVSEMTVTSTCGSDDRHMPHDSSKSWRKPLIDQIFITDVTSNFVTVTVKECLTDKGFFRQR